MRWLAVLVIFAACKGGAPVHGGGHDAGADAAPDAGSDAGATACQEFTAPGHAPPIHVAGTLSGADLESPAHCATVDAPYGTETAGPDSVVRLDGLQEGAGYVVRLTSSADLSFYVVTGCSAPTGPSSDECLLFEDASSSSPEVGQFVATGPTAYVVVDDYASSPPPDASFTLDVHVDTCTGDAECGGGTPICDHGACVECATSFDCQDPARPSCDPATETCQAGADTCLSDDPAEPGDDGPAGATVLAPDASGAAAATGQICSSPESEADYFAFDVDALGDTWDLSLQWTGSRDLDLALYDATGAPLGLSFWEHPEHVRLTYLPVGRYYAKVTEFSSSPDPGPVAYSVTAQRTPGSPCTGPADCAAEFDNQLFRGTCQAGACVAIDGEGMVPEGGACDHQADCAAGLSCPSFFFVQGADTRDVCARGCTGDADCAPLGADDVCTTYLQDNFCVQRCTSDLQCPVSVGDPPASGPWYRLTCDISTGRCLP